MIWLSPTRFFFSSNATQQVKFKHNSTERVHQLIIRIVNLARNPFQQFSLKYCKKVYLRFSITAIEEQYPVTMITFCVTKMTVICFNLSEKKKRKKKEKKLQRGNKPSQHTLGPSRARTLKWSN